jgi:hypothetical protein
MYGVLIFSFYKSFKLINSKYIFLKVFKKKIIFKNLNFFFLKKNIFFFLNKNYKNFYLKLFLKKLISFLKGFKIFFYVQGRRFKYFINSQYIFFKMDTSKFICLPLVKNIFLQKTKDITKLFFFNVKHFQLLKKIQKLKMPNNYTKKKKGIFFL